jgi:ankyrin repeat protein
MDPAKLVTLQEGIEVTTNLKVNHFMANLNKSEPLFPTVGEIIVIIANLLEIKEDRRKFRKDRLPNIIDKKDLERYKDNILSLFSEKQNKAREIFRSQFKSIITEYISFIKNHEKKCEVFDWLRDNYFKTFAEELLETDKEIVSELLSNKKPLKYAFQWLKNEYPKYKEFKLIREKRRFVDKTKKIYETKIKMDDLIKKISEFCNNHMAPEKIINIFIVAKIFENIVIEKNEYSQKNSNWQSIRSKGLKYLYAGKYKEALAKYKKFALDIFYTGDKDASQIYKESLVLAAALTLYEKDNIIFFKKLKHMGILFEELGESNSDIGNISKDQTINEGDIISFARRFLEFFPKKNFIDPKYYLSDKYDEPILDLNCPDKTFNIYGFKYPQIIWFSRENDIHSVKKLLEKNANTNWLSEPNNESALLCAIQNNNENMFSLIIEKTELKIINIKARDEFTCLGHAIDRWNLKLVESLLKHGANIEQSFTSKQQSPLYYAINKIIRSIKPTQPSDIMKFAENLSDDNCEEIRKILGSGITNSEIKEYYSNPLFKEYGPEIFKAMELNKEDYVPESERIPMIKLLLEYGAKPNAKQKNSNDTPMKLAERNKLLELLSPA